MSEMLQDFKRAQAKSERDFAMFKIVMEHFKSWAIDASAYFQWSDDGKSASLRVLGSTYRFEFNSMARLDLKSTISIWKDGSFVCFAFLSNGILDATIDGVQCAPFIRESYVGEKNTMKDFLEILLLKPNR